jgi:hypothetical protein
MGKNNNYFGEAAKLFQASDPLVAETAETLYQHMLAEYTRNDLKPIAGFNILYFFQSVIRLRFVGGIGTTVTSTEYLKTTPPIKGINVPGALHEQVLKDYVAIVKADSTPLGDDFDVGYALRIIAIAIEPNLELRPVVVPHMSDEVFDYYWLSGFNASDPDCGPRRT